MYKRTGQYAKIGAPGDKISIYSERLVQSAHFYDVVYEWEDCFCKQLKSRMVYDKWPSSGKNALVKWINRGVKTLVRPVKFYCRGHEFSIAFIMWPREGYRYKFRSMIPIYMDITPSDVHKAIYDTKKIPLFFVTSYDVCEYINKRNGDHRCYYLPFSVSDKHVSTHVVKKDIDVIQIGRKNQTLHSFMLDYVKTHPGVDYCFQQKKGGTYTYYSTKNGTIGSFSSRREFLKLLARSKISLVSSPSVDGNSRFGEFDFITPRFFESAVFYCHLLGRYTENKEADLLNIKDICPNILTRAQFDFHINNMLHTDCKINVAKYDAFIKQNTTSVRLNRILDIVKTKGLI